MERSLSTPRPAPAGKAISDPERWRRARRLFERTLERPPEERDTFIEEIGREDPRLVDEVRDLLRAHGAAHHLDRPIFDLLQRPATTPARLGPYQLGERIGAGGMGRVYAAQRVDGEIEQEVAIKILREEATTSTLVERFRRERQILAGLRHPHLTHLLDAGTTEDGRPYFVMERVRGVPLDQWVAHRRPGLEQRLELFESTCRAVEHAHLHGVVHRDLKPGNVLVDEGGRPHVVDFGVAALLDDRRPRQSGEAEGGGPLTVTGGVPMTLRYASPEQLKSSAVSAASDVYSLGILLFELLTDRSPYGEEPTPHGTLSALLDGDLPRPSSLETSWRPRLRGDLDALVARCLRRRPEERYRDAGELAADLRAHREGRPITARRGALYRAARGLRRRLPPALAAACLMGLVGTVWWQGERAQEAARIAGQTAETLSRLGGELARDGRSREAAGLFEQAVQLRSRLPSPSTPAGNFRTALADDLGALGDLQLREGAYAEAARSHRRSLELLSTDHAGAPRRARSLSALGLAESRLGDFAAGELKLLEGLGLARSVLGEAPRAEVRALHDYGRYLVDRGALKEAGEIFRRALELAGDLYRENDLELMNLRLEAAGAAAGGGRYAEAEVQLDRAGHGLARLPRDHPMRLFDLERRAFLAYIDSHHGQAEMGAREAMEGAVERFGENHPAVLAASRTLCQVLRDLLRHDEANAECARTVEVARALHGPGHPAVGDALVMQAEALEPLDRPQAMDLLTEALTIYRRAIGEQHPMVARIFHYRSLARLLANDRATAERFHRHAVEIYRATLGEGHPNLAYALLGFAGLLSQRGEVEAASATFRQALETLRLGLGDAHPRLTWFYAKFAVHLASHDLGGEEEARAALAVADDLSTRGAASAMATLSRILKHRGRLGESRRIAADLRATRADLPADSRRRLVQLFRRWQEPEAVAFWTPSPVGDVAAR